MGYQKKREKMACPRSMTQKKEKKMDTLMSMKKEREKKKYIAMSSCYLNKGERDS